MTTRETIRRRASLLGPVILVALLIVPCNALAQNQNSSIKPDVSPAGNAAKGKKIFAAQDCVKCHGNEGQGISRTQSENSGPRIGPPGKSVSAFITYVREPTGQMPPYSSAKVSDSELTDVYAFLQSLAQPPKGGTSSAAATSAGNATNGKGLYTTYGCYECHGHHGEGSLATGPRLSTLQLEFEDFVDYVRQPTGQMPPYTNKVISNAELADIYAFLQSLPQPRKPESLPLLK